MRKMIERMKENKREAVAIILTIAAIVAAAVYLTVCRLSF